MIGEAEYIRRYCDNELENIPSEWVSAKFENIIIDVTDSKKKVPQNKYKETGIVPIIDQGQSLIGGYCDDLSLRRNFDKPVIVFGDHTLAFKYIDFDFVQGADGVRVLMPLSVIDTKYIYYYFKYLPVPHKGYSRHFKYLKQAQIALPPLAEQERIVQKIESCFSKIEETEQNLNRVEILLEKYCESLLAKAFRGELIPQNSDDEPASVLLAKIREERAQNQKGKKKEQEFSPISDEEKPFDIPESWEWVKLGSVLKKVTDGTHHSPPNTPKGKYKYITAKNIRDWGLDLANITYVSPDVHKEIYSRCDPKLGDVFLIKDGATSGISCLNSLDEPFSMLSSVALLRVYPVAMSNEYLLYYLKSPVFQALVSDGMAGAAIKRITLSKINNMIIPLPPVEEQLRIIEGLKVKLDSVEHIRSQIKSKRNYLIRAKESILKKAFEGRLVEQIESEGTGHELLQKILEQKNLDGFAKEGNKKKVTKKVSKKKTTKK